MPMIEWNARLSVGIKDFDDEHKQLIKIINDLHEAMIKGKSKEVLLPILDRLIDYTATHFAHEEKVLRANGYPDAESHIAAHRELVAKAVEIQKSAREHVTSVLSMRTMSFLSDWLTSHIQGMDARYGAFLADKGMR